jgi:hypothetical protein
MLIGGAFIAWRAMHAPARYGTFTGAPRVEVADLIARPRDFAGKTVFLEGTVREQCKTMGCYFFLPSKSKMLRVDLQEIAMNAPTNEGRQARIEGRMVPYGEGYQLFASAVEFR